MPDQNDGVQKPGEGTPAGQAPTEEKKLDNPAGQEPDDKKTEGGDEWTPPSKEEYEATLKKANDFDGMVNAKRAAKLAKKEEKDNAGAGNQVIDEDTKEAILEKAREEGRKAGIEAANQQQFNSNLQPAYEAFVKAHPWANKDEMLDKIRNNFTPGNITGIKDITAALENAAEKTYPNEFRQAKEDSYKKKAMADQANIDAGDGGGEGGQPGAGSQAPSRKLDPEEEKFANAFGIKPE